MPRETKIRRQDKYRHSRRAGNRGRRKIRAWRGTFSPRRFFGRCDRTARRRRRAEKRKSGRITAPSNRERAVAVAAPRAQVSGATPTGRSRLGRALPPVTRKLIKLAAAPRRGERARPRSEPLLWRARRGPAFACKRCYDHGGSPSKATAVDHRLIVVENERKHAAPGAWCFRPGSCSMPW